MGILFTPQQEKIIKVREANILVSAAAGSGKTAVLVERIIEKICDTNDPVDVDRILVVTFTQAAATQMRERIRKGIENRISKEPENEYLQRQATLLHNALITTIHQFCLFVIRNHFHTIGLDPVFRVAEEGELKLLKYKVMQELMEEKFASKEEKFLDAIEYYCINGKEEKLENMIYLLHEFSMSYPFPKTWLLRSKEAYQVNNIDEFAKTQMGVYFIQMLEQRVKDLIGLYDKAIRIVELPDGPYMYGELLEQERESLEKLQRVKNLEDFYLQVRNISFAMLPRKKDESVDIKKREIAKELRDQVKEGIRKLIEQFFFIPFTKEWERQEECAKQLDTLIQLVEEYDLLYSQKKREKKIIDFHDIEHFALEILLDEDEDGIQIKEAAKEYKNYFKEIYIDEYQDSNLVQEYLLKAVSTEEEGGFNRFMVGDVKQSIYRFRLAKPVLFLEKFNAYKIEEGEKQRIDLRQNFRSRKEVLETVNEVFKKIMIKEVGGIVYDHNAALYPAATFLESEQCKSELICIQKPEKEEISGRKLEALVIARKIKEMRKSFQVVDEEKNEYRLVKYSDIVILLRSTTGWDEKFKEVLQEEGIPAFVSSKTGYFEVAEVQNILQYLKVLDNPLQDIPLYASLISIFGGFSEDEIGSLRSSHKDMSLFMCVKKAAEENEKCKKFIQKIEEYRQESMFLSASQLLQKIFTDFQYISYVTALTGGEQRKANVEMLLEKVKGIEKTNSHGLYYLNRYMEQLDKYEVDEGEANILDENTDSVRIMSIHKSKGLEFPVTFVAGLGKRFNMQDSTQAFLVDDELGLGMQYVDVKQRVIAKTLRRNILSTKNQEETIAEELRVLYVAMTRAKEKLILTGVVDKLEERLEKEELLNSIRPSNQLSPYELLTASSYWQFIFPSLSSFIVEKVAFEDIVGAQTKENIEQGIKFTQLNNAERLANNELVLKLEEQLRYIYPHQNLETLYTKTTVSELKKKELAMAGSALSEGDRIEVENKPLLEAEKIVNYIPKFISNEDKITGIMRGNAVHKVMELLPFERAVPTFQWINEFLEEEKKSGKLSEQYSMNVNKKKIQVFLASEIGKRVKLAAINQSLYKEQPFVYGIQASEMDENFPKEETILVQGIIDVFFEEEGEIVLLDYKTDMVETPEELKERYKIQFGYYTRALEKMMGKKVKQRILYSFYLGYAVEL